MMKKRVVAAIFFLIICAVASTDAEGDFPDKRLFPEHLHHLHLPVLQSGLKKCFSALHDEGKTCSREIFLSFWKHRFLVGSDCCQAMKEAEEDCSAALFSHFNPFFCHKLENYCAHKISTPPKNSVLGSSAPAPSPSTPTPSSAPPSSAPTPSLSNQMAPSSTPPSSPLAPSSSDQMAPSSSAPAPSFSDQMAPAPSPQLA